MAVLEYRKAAKAYAKQRADMIDLAVGDVVEVYSAVAKGWAKGVNLRTKLKGWFPYAYTQPTQNPGAAHVATSPAPSIPATPQTEGPKPQPRPAPQAQVAKPAKEEEDSYYYSDEEEGERKQEKQETRPDPAQLKAYARRIGEMEAQIEELKKGKTATLRFVLGQSEQIRLHEQKCQQLRQQLYQVEQYLFQYEGVVEGLAARNQKLQNTLRQLEQQQRALEQFGAEKEQLRAQLQRELDEKENQNQKTQMLIQTAGLGGQRVDWGKLEMESVMVRKQNRKLAAQQELVPTPASPAHVVRKRKDAKTRQSLDVELEQIRAKYGTSL